MDNSFRHGRKPFSYNTQSLQNDSLRCLEPAERTRNHLTVYLDSSIKLEAFTTSRSKGPLTHLLMASFTKDDHEAQLHIDHHPDVDKKHVESQIPIYNNVELASSEDLSFGAIIRGTAARPLTTFEKKAALINAELDKFGLGRYQICIWFLCGFGYFLDLAWAQGVGLIATAIYQEMGVADKDTGTIFALANAGLAIGALGFGLAVDIIGRKWAFNLTCLITSIFGLLLVCIVYVNGEKG